MTESIISEEETIVGVHTSGIELQEGLNTSLSRNYCANCKRKIHCFVKVDRTTNEAIVHNTCKSQECKCKCKTHYACKKCGYLHPYGEKCNRTEPQRVPDPRAEAEFKKLMKQWDEIHPKIRIQ